jgi:hypothetical protein
MNKNVVSKTLAKMPGFKKSGSFYIGTCNDNVIAGYGLDAPPSAVYIWKFALPSYDDVEFLHFGLGKRILTLPQGNDTAGDIDLSDFLQRDWSAFFKVNDCESLIRYIDVEKLGGTYALWARYLTDIRCKDFDAAERLQGDAGVAKKFSELQAISKQFADLSEVRNRRGWEGCSALLDEWQRKTRAAYC